MDLRRLAFLVIASTAAVLAGVILGPGAALAADVTLLSPDGLQPGMDGRQPINAPGSGYTRVKAESDDPDDMQVENPNVTTGGMGFSYTLKGDPGRPVVVTVTWLNPQTGDKQYRFYVFVVKSAKYPFQPVYERTDAVTVYRRSGKATVKLPIDRSTTD